ncbi:MAG: orotate phosphoribosyltransferase [Candidatus Omnitrophica bacterium]|jgi:orotate phosphoribosyltransferase|nr:orotate phosphoribosyltransferase [Candidatus Omnitrophota bacterium]
MKEQLLNLLKKDAWYKGEVKLSSGKISNFYIDVRRVSLSSEGSYLISHLIWDLIKDDEISAIGGPTLGADPIVGGVCMVARINKKNLGGFLIRKTPKEHGRQQLIEGKELLEGERVVIIDDVATSGSSLIKSIEVLKKEKVRIVKAVSVIDREEGATENLAKFNCPLVSLFKKSDFFD